jgi:hypothetical protein
MSSSEDPKHDDEFLKQASGKQAGLVSELIGFLRVNNTWWLAPILISIRLLGLLVALGVSAAATLIYTLF